MRCHVLFLIAFAIVIFSVQDVLACTGDESDAQYQRVIAGVRSSCSQASSYGVDCGSPEAIIQQACGQIRDLMEMLGELAETGGFSGELGSTYAGPSDITDFGQQGDGIIGLRRVCSTVYAQQSMAQAIFPIFQSINDTAQRLEQLGDESAARTEAQVQSEADALIGEMNAQVDTLSGIVRDFGGRGFQDLSGEVSRSCVEQQYCPPGYTLTTLYGTGEGAGENVTLCLPPESGGESGGDR